MRPVTCGEQSQQWRSGAAPHLHCQVMVLPVLRSRSRINILRNTGYASTVVDNGHVTI
jgi:hypothetical protein